jgi:hypothetical protein
VVSNKGKDNLYTIENKNKKKYSIWWVEYFWKHYRGITREQSKCGLNLDLQITGKIWESKPTIQDSNIPLQDGGYSQN